VESVTIFKESEVQKSLPPLFSSCLYTLFSVHSKKSTEQMKKVPTIVLSVSYKGVKFIDATNKVTHSSSDAYSK